VSGKYPPKRDVMMALLQQSPYVNVHLDPRIDGVVLPPQLRRQKRILLQYGLNMRIPIPDLDVGDEGIGATLSFNRIATWTFVPWAAVFAVLSEDQRSGLVWEEDLPRDFEPEPPPSDGKAALAKKGPGAKKGGPEPRRPALRAVAGGKDEPGDKAVRAEEPRAEAGTVDEDAAPPIAAAKPAKPIKPTLAVHTATTRDGERPSAEGAPSATNEPRSDDESIVEPEPPSPTGGKKKRELPPYLRVVK
jgi:stringent starvation protein B